MRPTVLQISTEAIAHNARVFRESIDKDVRLMYVVKANAYGHDSVRTAKKLMEMGADAFAVAIVEEARTLREAGVKGMILVLGGACESSLRESVAADASQAVYEPWMLDVLEDEAKKLGVKAKAHLKLDTGMSRIGVRDADALDTMLEHWKACPNVIMEGLFTHFCVADTDPDFTSLQRERFEAGLARVRAAGHSPIAHAAATSAMLEEALQFDMVRPGIGLYGSCVPKLQDRLVPAQKLSTRPIRLQRIAAGETVGYGRTYTAERDTVVMTIPIGYGDGYPRILSNRASVLVRGKRCPIVGRVCMDMTMVDVTDVEGVTLSDEVVLLGAQGGEVITADELAEFAQTIPYEIMLGFGARIPVEVVD